MDPNHCESINIPNPTAGQLDPRISLKGPLSAKNLPSKSAPSTDGYARSHGYVSRRGLFNMSTGPVPGSTQSDFVSDFDPDPIRRHGQQDWETHSAYGHSESPEELMRSVASPSHGGAYETEYRYEPRPSSVDRELSKRRRPAFRVK